ncbi:MAG: hypothetical protein A2751_03565 [Candidatus Doudnabacteria bacterium RIFCSPHIGHO2_01_FULL_46_14]|uniref:Type II secretion system protein GspG C-terminal domain-containing protein n=1 Tax=Candidatus Doudnabacteria bacterium RIFCSPHIGHO2_01_FULL_46_14 TaxID=1817824 RepID=A0A1F5NKR2_9BACT|nr:MAG: hypothetical protein A2751_03565 [Candidatus Doudnabacteria bacterium RIFCSPHIGHO2_01_FULL_46_14]
MKQKGLTFTLRLRSGFTLIELLVVISVIGLLASVILISLNSARAKARDAKRIADIRQIQKALELYYDQNNEYPRYDGGGIVTCGGAWATTDDAPTFMPCWNDLQTKLSPYINRLPVEILWTSSGYHYKTQNSGQGYYLLMYPENNSMYRTDSPCYDSQGSLWWCTGNNWE